MYSELRLLFFHQKKKIKIVTFISVPFQVQEAAICQTDRGKINRENEIVVVFNPSGGSVLAVEGGWVGKETAGFSTVSFERLI